jgi:hypothetical protein
LPTVSPTHHSLAKDRGPHDCRHTDFPVILFLMLGILTALIQSDLAIPKAFAKVMWIFSMAGAMRNDLIG